MKNVIIIGAGAAGCFAAISASRNGANVTIYEKNHMIGKKMRITGKGRCNVTNASDIEDIIKNIYKNGNFMYSSLYTYTNDDLIQDLNTNGCSLKVERGNRVFPKSDKAIDVVKCIEKMMMDLGVNIELNSQVTDLIVENNSDDMDIRPTCSSKNVACKIKGIVLKGGKKIYADAVIIATGGMSYPLTGSTGDGYRILKKYGHNTTELRPALVGLETKKDIPQKMVGLNLRNIGVKLYADNMVIYEDFGELEFRDYGIDGPTIKSSSCHIDFSKHNYYKVSVDLKPALSEDKLDLRIQRDFKKYMNNNFKEGIKDLLPQSIIDYVIEETGINPQKKIHQVTRDERLKLIKILKNLEFRVVRTRPINEAIVTSGGINVKEINPSTMESKLIKDLYICGEIIDVDAYTGGFNLQVAFSTGYLAGMNSSQSE